MAAMPIPRLRHTTARSVPQFKSAFVHRQDDFLPPQAVGILREARQQLHHREVSALQAMSHDG
jgi:hypothetical protein